RDFHVTGVQTCALPIYRAPARPGLRRLPLRGHQELRAGRALRRGDETGPADADHRPDGGPLRRAAARVVILTAPYPRLRFAAPEIGRAAGRGSGQVPRG